ncbi:MAG TPA: undecaprenyldiphospho-muramoylpentapeptide beta-N-acetylglucosaminyltransferase [Thermoanaerobaculia bacterium]|jgi:UDP-N-acetylglucosamine--N-acetylmuramyl-(pentapeptide) pyrophosphoryl-undecaprenol N-acetylglucosamine transferase|nr:undecaprenyldiphospho-muramoylpentapeptide beta-N-acetylglucosaminyltransferase [Thermoanaerobaculia bacterium]
MANPISLHVLLAGGGTGGHVFPALAVGDELRARGARVSFTGMAGGIEERLAGERGIPFHPLPARPLVGRGIAAKLGALTTLARSAGAAKRLIREIGADVVLGTGGYVSAPAVIGARRAGRPVLLLEPNGKAGVANRWLSRWATAADVGYRETMADLKCPSRLTGVPVRPAFFAVSAATAAAPASPLRLLVLGGSQGAQQINEAMPAAAKLLLARLPGLTIVHQAGARNLEAAKAAYLEEGLDSSRIEIVPFLDDVAGAMAASHLLISRAGAITIAEICAAGRPSVLVPLAIAKAHQMDNARLLVEAGGAVVIPSDQFSPERLAEQIAGLLSGGPALEDMGRAARSLARPRAAADIADHLEEIGGAR